MHASALALLVALGAAPQPASAQLADGLRGTVLESRVFDDLNGTGVSSHGPDDLVTGTVEAPPGDGDLPPIVYDPDFALPAQAAETQAPAMQGLPDDDGIEGRTGRDALREAPLEQTSVPPDPDPFAATGIRAGTFILRPTLDQGLAWTSNAGQTAQGEDALFSETALRLEATSDWSRHEARFDADLRFREPLSSEGTREFQGGAGAGFRQEIGTDHVATYALTYRAAPESPSSPLVDANVVNRPLRHDLGASAEIAREAGRLRWSAITGVERQVYEDARLSDDTILSQDDRDATTASLVLRGGYEVSPALVPFAEVEIGRRIHDREFDADGYRRSADFASARAGVELDLGEKLTGEIAAGWIGDSPDDDRLAGLSAPYLDGRLSWSPQRGTDIGLAARSSLEGSTVAGESGAVVYTLEAALDHRLRHDLTATALIGFDWRDYEGAPDEDRILRAEASMTWWLNRNAGVTGRLSHEVLDSSIAGRGYDETGAYLGITLRR